MMALILGAYFYRNQRRLSIPFVVLWKKHLHKSFVGIKNAAKKDFKRKYELK